jgi:DHA1 family tetracycline resistance protein-like MFS transporter
MHFSDRGPVTRSPLPIVFFTIFLDLLGIGILIPVIPQLLANPNSPFFMLPEGWPLDRGYLLLGALIAVFPLMQFACAPILGELSDKFGRKPVLLFSLLGTGLGYVVFALGVYLQSLPTLFLARALDGATGGNISVAQAAISDSTLPEHRARNFGLIGAAFGLGFILGPYLGGKLSDPAVVSWFDAATPFWFAALLSLGNALFVRFRLPETLKVRQQDKRIDWRKSAKNINHAWALGPLRSLFVTTFLFQFGFSSFTTFSSVFLIDRFGFTQGSLGDFYAYLGLWIAFSQAVITRQVNRRLAEVEVLRWSLFAAGLSILLYLVPSQWWGLLLVAPVFAAFNGLCQANLLGLLSRSAGGRIQGEVLGINASVQALGQAMPPLMSGVIAGILGPAAPIVVSAAVIAGSGVFFLAVFRPVATPVE